MLTVDFVQVAALREMDVTAEEGPEADAQEEVMVL
jgi:hypothetical protein